MIRITTVTNQKGGVGKTTTALALATGLTLKGYAALVIDTDPQGNLSFTMGADASRGGVYGAMRGDYDPESEVQHTAQGYVLPASQSLAGADLEFTQTGREYLLRDMIAKMGAAYDHIIIDTPPQLGIMTVNALAASTDVIIPMGADIYSLQGLLQLHSTIETVRKYCNPSLAISGILITRYSGRTVLGQDLRDGIEDAAGRIGATVYHTAIREGVAIREAQAQRLGIYASAPKSNQAQDYRALVTEYLEQERGL